MENLEENNTTMCLVWDLLKVKILDAKILNEHAKDKEDLKQNRDSAFNELKIQLKYQADGSHNQARAKWIEEGEKTTSYFLGLEKRRQQDYVIEKVEIDGKFTENESETLGEIHSFYTNLYTTRNTENPNTFLNKITLNNKLTSSTNALCEGYITPAECQHVIDTMKVNTSP